MFGGIGGFKNHAQTLPTSAAAILSATTGLAHARACAEQITQLRQAGQLDHEPTPERARQAQTYDQLMFVAALAEAEALDAEGNETECLMAARRAKQMLEPGYAVHL